MSHEGLWAALCFGWGMKAELVSRFFSFRFQRILGATQTR